MKDRVILKEISEIVTGNTPKTSEIENYSSNDIPFAKPSDINDFSITQLERTEFFISEHARKKARIAPKGSILVTCIGIIGKIAILKEESAFNQQINAVIPNEKKINKDYLAYAILSKKNYLQEKANAPVVPIINKTDFSTVEIPICSIDKQVKIAKILNKLNQLIALKKEQLKKLDEFVKSLFIEMFGDINQNERNMAKVRFIECVESSLRGPFGSDMKKSLYVPKSEKTYKVYSQINAIQQDQSLGSYYISNVYYTEKMHRFELFPNEYIITCDGTLGKILELDDKMELGVISSSLLKIKLNYDKIMDAYFIELWNTYLLPILKKEARNACLLHFPSMKIIGSKKIPLPSITLQNEFANKVKLIDKSKFVVLISIKKSFEMCYKVSLLQNL